MRVPPGVVWGLYIGKLSFCKEAVVDENPNKWYLKSDMKHIFRAIFASLTVGLGLFAAVLPASAATSPWSWSDISGQLVERSSRPIWASEYASGSWYYTDGIDLYSGGHVYRYDGATQVDITMDVRSAGLSRVDDIVSDGVSVLMLKNVVSSTNTVEVVRYTSGTITNVTTVFRNALQSNEGIGFLSGKNSTWYLVTTKGRLMTWNGLNDNNFVLVSLPNVTLDTSNSAIGYNVKHGSPQDGMTGLPLSIVPYANGFLLVEKTVTGLRFYTSTSQTYGTTGFVDVTTSFGQYAYLDKIASDGNSVLIFAGYADATRQYATAGDIFTFNGTPIKVSTGGYSTYSGAQISTSSILADWTGSEWMIVSGKNVSRIINNQLETNTPTRDYFTTISSNASGVVLLGGTVSTDGNNGPSYPLTAKLVKATTGSAMSSGVVTTVNSGTTTANQPSVWTWLDPNQTWINLNQTVTFYAGAWSANGLQRIDMYANGALRRTCTLSNAYGNQQCSVVLSGNDYSSNQNVTLTAMATDSTGKTTWSGTQSVQTSNAYTSSYNGYYNGYNYNNYGSTTAYDLSAWGTMDPAGATLLRSNSLTYHAQASASQGLQRIDVYANDVIVRSCTFSNQTGTQICDATINGYSYSANSQLSIRALATDIYGHTAWSDTKSVTLQDASSTYYSGYSTYPYYTTYPTYSTYPTYTNSTYQNYATANNGSSWVWSAPEQSTLAQNASVVFNVGAWDPEGIQRIEIYVNSALAKTCTLNNATGNQTCSTSVYGGSYTAGTSVVANAKITDTYGNVFWSDSRSYTIQSTPVSTATYTRGTTRGYGSYRDGHGRQWSLPTTTTSNGTVRVTSDHQGGYSTGDTVTITATADNITSAQTINILIDGQLVKTCQGQSTCSVSPSPGGATGSLMYGATVTGGQWSTAWTGYQTLKKR